MIKIMVVVLLVSVAVSNCFDISSKADCTVGKRFTTSEHDSFVRECKDFMGRKYSSIVGCKGSKGELVDFGTTYDYVQSEYQGFRYKCVKEGRYYKVNLAGCLMGKAQENIPVGESKLFDTTKCDCTDRGVTCMQLP